MIVNSTYTLPTFLRTVERCLCPQPGTGVQAAATELEALGAAARGLLLDGVLVYFGAGYWRGRLALRPSPDGGDECVMHLSNSDYTQEEISTIERGICALQRWRYL